MTTDQAGERAGISYDQYNYLFVMTYGRSGSTILMRLLNEDPTFLIRGENGNMLHHLMKSIFAVRVAARKAGEAEEGVEHPWFGASQIDARGYEAAVIDSFVAHVLSPTPGVKTLGFKEIRYTARDEHMDDKEYANFIKGILELFPNSRIIFNTRPWDQIARSGWWADQDPAEVRETITLADQRFARTAEQFPERTRMFSFEDLKNPGQALHDLLAFAGCNLTEADIKRVLSRKISNPRESKVRKALRRLGI